MRLIMAGLGVFTLIAIMASGQTQQELNIASSESLKKADATLNTVYKEVMSSVLEAQKPLIKSAELAWISYRDKCVESEGSIYSGGSIESMIRVNAARDLTLERIDRLKSVLPGAVQKLKTSLPDLASQREKLAKADAKMNKVYKKRMADDPLPAIKEAQLAWLAYRDACTKSEAAAYDDSKDGAEIITAKSATELTTARTERLKELFIERYSDDEPAENAKSVPAK